MKIRTVYFKILNMQDACTFWESFLGFRPHKKGDKYSEFRLSNINLGLVLNDFGDVYSGSNCTPVFEFDDTEISTYIERAKSLKAKIILDGLDDPNIKGIVFADPFGNEFEVTKFHD